MEATQLIEEINKFESLQHSNGVDDYRPFLFSTAWSNAKELEAMMDTFEEFVAPVLRSFDLNFRERVVLLKGFFNAKPSGYVSDIPWSTHAPNIAMTSCPAEIQRNVSNGSRSNYINEPVTINFTGMSSSTTLPVDLSAMRKAVIDCLALQFANMI